LVESFQDYVLMSVKSNVILTSIAAMQQNRKGKIVMIAVPRIRKLTSDLIEDLKKNRWVSSGEVRLGNNRTLLCYQQANGQIGMEVFSNLSRLDQIRRKRIEASADKVTWCWRVAHDFVSRPIEKAALRERMDGPAANRIQAKAAYELRRAI
jgi:hypothetical protein